MSPDTTQGPARTKVGRWLLVDGARLSVTVVLLSAILVLLTALAALGLVPRTPSNPMYFLFSAVLGGNLTLITVVLSINQLVLSREHGAPGDLYQRIRDAMAYRSEVAETAGTVPSPVSPGNFLRYLHENILDDATKLRETVSKTENERLAMRVEDLVDDLAADVETVTQTLDSSTVDIFAVIEATLGTNHADQLHELTALEAEFGDLTDEQRGLLDELREQLLHIDTARKYFRTVYVEKELSYFSRVILYVGVPTQVFVATVLVLYGAMGTGPPTPAWVLPLSLGAVTVGFAPLAVLFSFVLRLSWVAQRNTSVAPFSASTEDYST